MAEKSRDHELRRFLPEVVTHICRVGAADRETAQVQIREALAEGLGPLYWDDRGAEPDVIGTIASDDPPGPGPLWHDANINFEDGTVLEFGLVEERRPRRRMLLVHPHGIDKWWPDRAAKTEADKRSRALERDAAVRDFEAVYWPTAQVLRWLAWHDPALINKPWGPAILYPDPAFRGDPRPILLRAVQEGRLKGSKNGVELPPEAWAGVSMYVLLEVHFQRKDVLKRWPAGRIVHPSRLRPFWQDAEAALMEWLQDNGCPAPGDGNQAKLEHFSAEWLEKHGWEASPPTIRRHVRSCMERYRSQRAG